MLLRSGKTYDPMMSTNLRNFMKFDNELFRTWWDEYANQVNEYGKTHTLNEKESNIYFKEQLKLLKLRCMDYLQNNP